MIDLRQLRYFAAVAEELHFGRAAERVGIAQPPLTQQIQKLERDLGYPLFARNSRRTSLTEVGRVLLDETRRLMSGFDGAIEHARRAGRGEMGQLRVGTPPSVMLTRLPSVIRKYRRQYPDVSFNLREASTGAILRELQSGALDVGFLREAEPGEELASEAVLREPVMAVLPSAHPLARKSHLTLRQLSNDPFVLFPRSVGEAFYDRLIRFCADAGFMPRVVQEATQWQSVVTFVETGLGVSIAPACVAKLRWKGVVYRPLPGLTTTVFAAWQTANTPPAVGRFLSMVRVAAA
jgi:DNA-binding transcriptional LysR family regulator